jgi:hypothetical protein
MFGCIPTRPSRKITFEILRPCELPNLSVSSWPHDAQDQGFQFADVIVTHREIHAEPIPGIPVLVTEVLL